ncbi:response regulator transcription factor [Campylobacter insulaenigrae]|uniref:Response regulatory domain-containing protein n=1 Tax=Campylobacter insulaenigrae TaxID=260714 RepID=A0ABY3G3X2_9BACT|nr:response regulator transcription factor [Campylobacter insulaenigrae]MCR6571046.1 response regulator transcription factor [Campylobacter insulaenigrae]MCR6572696.1 response regulator transcription factor [Campylobacter insulaenigrae]MCR6574080.1 response regulator transcription factor [Campylobacter insulaenigrae]MCR6575422.1 response regulator transcription factor [Campylobacter insulaenigrae]MCR6583620.1 response regulator transcription factor [Campylobacter insulaenigrae]
MKVLIVENEFYLAQSIGSKLNSIGYNCDIITSTNELTHYEYEIILLSTSIANFEFIVETFKHKIIILLISYISSDTVLSPLKAGASDYIQKPFMIEELTRKIKHFQDFKKMEILNHTYEAYLKHKFETIKIAHFDYKKIKLPLILKANNQIQADCFVFNYSKQNNIASVYVNLSHPHNLDKILKDTNTYYLTNFQSLKPLEKEKILNLATKKSIIIHTNNNIENKNFQILELIDEEKNFESNGILTIDDYVKHIILSYQNVFPDTDLSKKLGISRKSLWEKRKKYGISKKK